jgi:hypothetical protein
MNVIKLTVELFEGGYEVFVKACNRAPPDVQPREVGIAALEDFCAGEGLVPADVAAAAIIARAGPIFLAGADDVDLKLEFPDYYRSYIVDPIEPEEMGLFAED